MFKDNRRPLSNVHVDGVLLQLLEVWVEEDKKAKSVLTTRLTRIPGASELDSFKPFPNTHQFHSQPEAIYNNQYCPVEAGKQILLFLLIELFDYFKRIMNRKLVKILKYG